MKIKTRLANLERRYRPSRFGAIPFFVDKDDPDGVMIDGEFLTWAKLEARYPEAPKPLHWSDDDRFREGAQVFTGKLLQVFTGKVS